MLRRRTDRQPPAGTWLELLARPRYAGFALTVAGSQICSLMFPVAGVLLVLGRTGSASLAGATTAAAVLPAALSGPLLGAWLDVTPRRRPLIVADRLLSVAALLGLVALAGHGPRSTLPLVAVVYGITTPISIGSFYGAQAALAGPKLLDRASAVSATTMNLAVVIGPALAGVLAGVIGAARVVELQAALTVVTAGLIAINPAFERRAGKRSPSARHALAAGARSLRESRMLRGGIAANSLGAFSWGLMTIGFPVYASHTLGAQRAAAGYLWAAVAIGSIAGTFALAQGPDTRRMAASYAAFGCSALLWPLAHALAPGFGLILFTGVLEGPAFAGAIALQQRLAPDRARTAVLNTGQSITTAAMAVGQLVGGITVELTGTATVAIVVFACADVCAGGLLAAASRVRAGTADAPAHRP
jgi:MFS family permease